MALDLGKVNDQWLEDADLRNLPCGQLFSKIIDKFAERGVLVMLDMHRYVCVCVCVYVFIFLGGHPQTYK